MSAVVCTMKSFALTDSYSIFPGLGLGAILAKCATIPEALIHESAAALASSVTEEEKSQDMLYPRLERIRKVSGISAYTRDTSTSIDAD